MVNGNLVLTILCVTELQLLLLICSFIFNYQKLNILSTNQCKFWTWTKTCERKINFFLLAWQMFSCGAPAQLLLHWRLFWFHFLLKLLLFMGKRNVVSLPFEKGSGEIRSVIRLQIYFRVLGLTSPSMNQC